MSAPRLAAPGEDVAQRQEGSRVAWLSGCPRLSRGFRFQWEPAQQAHVLLYPEGMVKLNPSAAEILRRCDGHHDVAGLVDELETVFATRGLRGDVEAFLQLADQQGWIDGLSDSENVTEHGDAA